MNSSLPSYLNHCLSTMSHYLRIRELARNMRKHSTPAEDFFWQKVRNRKLFGLKFHRQFIFDWPVDSVHTKFYIADFYCGQLNLIIELDGQIHLKRQEEDIIRTERLEQLGFQVVRFSNDQVLNYWELVESIINSLVIGARTHP